METINQQMRDLVGDNGYFKEINLDIGKLRSLAYANIAGTAGADLVTISGGGLKLTAAQTYTNGNVFLYALVTLPRDAVKRYRDPLAAATVAFAPDFKITMTAKAGTGPTARTISCVLTGTNPDGTTVTTKTKTASLAAVTTAQAWSFDFAGSWTTSDTPPLPGAMLQFAFSPSGDIDQDVTLYGLRMLYRGNAAITNDETRQVGATLTTLPQINQ